MLRHYRRLLAAIALAMSAGCVTPATEVVVSLASDAPDDRQLRIRVGVAAGSTTDAPLTQMFVRGSGSGEVALPASFAVVPPSDGPRDGTATLVVEAEVVATDTRPMARSRRVARFTFTRGVRTQLPIFLAARCWASSTGCLAVPDEGCTVWRRCEDQGTTCGNSGNCVPLEVATIREDDGGLPDAATTMDATADDAATIDAGVDATATDPDVIDANTCPSTSRRCGDQCLDVQSDRSNCGACDFVCPTEQACVAAVCVCPSGGTLCGNRCVDLLTDRNNCGACDNVCPGTLNCVAQACQ